MTPLESPTRWLQLCRTLSPASSQSESETIKWFHRLQAAYHERHRHYHNGHHIAECLRNLDLAATLAHEPAAIEFALWFHDAIYDPHSATNEEDSAALAESCLRSIGANGGLIPKISTLILATKHHHVEPGTDAALLVDIDLAILGQPPEAFALYEAQIRREFNWVPNETFATKRAEILLRFLARPRIYTSQLFFDRFEATARINLQQSIQQLDAIMTPNSRFSA
jgi:predicted metal-dependent HD superfamily phosphohydrolase